MAIAFLNFCGISIARHLGAATRMVLDSLRILVVWGVSLVLGWQEFCYMQVCQDSSRKRGFERNGVHSPIRVLRHMVVGVMECVPVTSLNKPG